MNRLRIVGCGAPGAGDDQLGLAVARRLREVLPPEIDILEDAGGGARVDAWCEGVDRLIIVDAALADAAHPPGTHLRLAYPDDADRLLQTPIRDTHRIPLAQGLCLADRLGLLPRQVFIHVLTAACFEPATPLSPGLREPLERLVAHLHQEVLEAK